MSKKTIASIENFIKELTELTNKTGIVINSTDTLFIANDSGAIADVRYDYKTQKYLYHTE